MQLIGQAVGGLSPEAQVVLIVCLFALALVVLMIIFMMIVDRRKMQTATKGVNRVMQGIARLRKNRSLKEPPDQSMA